MHADSAARPAAARRRPALPFAAWLFAAAASSGCTAPAPEAALREAVAGLEAAVEAGDAGDVAGLLATDFAGPGGMDRDAAHRLARAAFLRNRDIGVVLGPLDIAMHDAAPRAAAARGASATVRFTAAFAGGRPGGLLPVDGSVYRVETGWRLEDGDWRLSSARWERDL